MPTQLEYRYQTDGEGDKLDLYVTEQSIQHVRLHLDSLLKRKRDLAALPSPRLTPNQRAEYELLALALDDFYRLLIGR